MQEPLYDSLDLQAFLRSIHDTLEIRSRLSIDLSQDEFISMFKHLPIDHNRDISIAPAIQLPSTVPAIPQVVTSSLITPLGGCRRNLRSGVVNPLRSAFQLHLADTVADESSDSDQCRSEVSDKNDRGRGRGRGGRRGRGRADGQRRGSANAKRSGHVSRVRSQDNEGVNSDSSDSDLIRAENSENDLRGRGRGRASGRTRGRARGRSNDSGSRSSVPSASVAAISSFGIAPASKADPISGEIEKSSYANVMNVDVPSSVANTVVVQPPSPVSQKKLKKIISDILQNFLF